MTGKYNAMFAGGLSHVSGRQCLKAAVKSRHLSRDETGNSYPEKRRAKCAVMRGRSIKNEAGQTIPPAVASPYGYQSGLQPRSGERNSVLHN
jgi:hypothetical protein